MKRNFVAICLGVTISLPAAAQTVEPAKSFKETEQILHQLVDTEGFPGAVALLGEKDCDSTWYELGHLSHVPASPAATKDSLWRIYSMTKPITGIAAMMLIEDGKLGLDQPISDFIPAFRSSQVLLDPASDLTTRPAARPITVRHLLTHTSGLGYAFVLPPALRASYEQAGLVPMQYSFTGEAEDAPRRPKSLQQFAEAAARQPLLSDPGTSWTYSISVDVLGAVIEKASGMPFERFLEKRLFGPLRMTHTHWTVSAQDTANLSSTYAYAGFLKVAIDPGNKSVFSRAPSFAYGGSGLVSSAEDYDRFLRMIENGGTFEGRRVMKADTVRMALSDLLPAGVKFDGLEPPASDGVPTRYGFGAGGMVTLSGPSAGTFGWDGAAGTVGFVNPQKGYRGILMVSQIGDAPGSARTHFRATAERELLSAR
ncbi:serine hydrolase domain-containing protein [Sphingopyxis sp.]|uniref:serine hydrolase domain-containing protein n=1 Tax=Sphingopyxis sp. TaxID=1908224 RepID=UPI002D77FD0E|nr:serine hydrolase domain-containing protein [Sphingopyxis sp.]HET6522893.1 serine hydrolase domain-containing protein [Sphingopyxis sp.]